MEESIVYGVCKAVDGEIGEDEDDEQVFQVVKMHDESLMIVALLFVKFSFFVNFLV